MAESIPTPAVLVTGDVSLECFSILESEGYADSSTSSQKPPIPMLKFYGGAQLLERILRILVARRLAHAKGYRAHLAQRLDAQRAKPAALEELIDPLTSVNALHEHYLQELQKRRSKLYEAKNAELIDLRHFHIERLKINALENQQFATLYHQIRTALRDMDYHSHSRFLSDEASNEDEATATGKRLGELEQRIHAYEGQRKIIFSCPSNLDSIVGALKNAWLVKSYPHYDTIPGAMRLERASDPRFFLDSLSAKPDHSGVDSEEQYHRWIKDAASTFKTALESRRPIVYFFNDYGRMAMSHAVKSMMACHGEDTQTVVVLVTRDLRALLNDSRLWQILQAHLDRTVIILSASAARRAGINISKGISWERTAYDLHSQIRGNQMLKDFSHARHIVVRCGIAGALHVHDRSSVLYYSTESMEADAHDRDRTGGMGYYSGIIGATIVESILWELAGSSDIETVFRRGVGPAIHRGILNCQAYYREGLGNSVGDAVKAIERMNQEDQSEVGEKAPRCLRELETVEKWKDSGGVGTKGVASTVFEVDVQDDPQWTILDPRHREFENVAHRIVAEGIVKAQAGPMGFPVGRFGNLVTVDRREIEGYRTIRNLMRDYCSPENKDRSKKPLCIAVFGPPGAGKSFGVREIAKSIGQGQKEPFLFNVAQFTTPDDLATALIRVKEVAVDPVVPLAFFDEFDASLDEQELGWLRFFLAPMHDGQFKHQKETLSVGRAVLVFAGGVSNTFVDFGREQSVDPKDVDMFRQAKGPDFVSRLRGVVDIMGVNRTNEWDSAFVIRRAVTLRILLEATFGKLLEDGKCKVDSSVVSAFLKVRRYKHGIRSIQAILEMSQLSDAKSLHKHQLPIESQLSLHVDAWEFHELINRHEVEMDSKKDALS